MSGNWLAHQVRSRPDAPAVRLPRGFGAEPRELTYRELGRLAARAAARLAEAGVDAGDRVAVALPGTVEHVAAIHAVSRLGAVLVPVDPRLDAATLRARVDRAGAHLLVTADRPSDPPCPVLAAGALTDPANATADLPPPAPQPPDGLCSIVFTSGSSGRPDPVQLTHGNHLASATASAFNLGIDRRDDWLCCLPLVHVGGLAIVLRSVLYGTTLTLMDGFDPVRVAELLRAGRVTLASLVPTMLRRLLALEEPLVPAAGSDPDLRAILLGGGPADPELIERAWRAGLPVLATYGMTETASQVATVPLERLPAAAGGSAPAAGSVGAPLLGAEIAIRNPDDRAPLPAGEVGEVWVRGPMVSPTAPTASLDEKPGWLRTGDLGRLDEGGDLWVIGRRDQVIVTGGENVSPERVETALGTHPAVSECTVVGVEDPEWGRMVAAAVVPHDPDRPPEPESLAGWCRERLAPYEVPKRWRLVSALPRTATGKPRRAVVAGLFDDGAGN